MAETATAAKASVNEVMCASLGCGEIAIGGSLRKGKSVLKMTSSFKIRVYGLKPSKCRP